MFNDEEEILYSEDQLLESTEYRIFCTYQDGGIHDNDHCIVNCWLLQVFRQYHLSSYKNRIKNRSFVPNDEFESRIIMEIESV